MPPGLTSAVPAAGWAFREWTGAAVGGALSANVTMTADKSVNAIFEQLQLTVTKSGEGQVTADPYGATQTPTFSEDYEPGETVTLTAVPAAGWGRPRAPLPRAAAGFADGVQNVARGRFGLDAWNIEGGSSLRLIGDAEGIAAAAGNEHFTLARRIEHFGQALPGLGVGVFFHRGGSSTVMASLRAARPMPLSSVRSGARFLAAHSR